MVITMWGDFACPFCYVGETCLERAVRELGLKDVEIDFMAYELDPDMSRDTVEPAPEHFMRAYGMTKEKAMAQIGRIERYAQRSGVGLNYPDAKYCSTFDAHRLVKLVSATDKTAVAPLIHALFAAFFVEGKVIADRSALEEIAVNAGLDAAKVRAVLDSDLYADDVRTNEREADKQGVETIPYLLFDGGSPLTGALTPGEIRIALQKQISGADVTS